MQEATEIIAKLKEEAVVIIATTVATLVPTFVLGCILNKKITTYKDSIGYLQQEVQDIKEKIETKYTEQNKKFKDFDDYEKIADEFTRLEGKVDELDKKLDDALGSEDEYTQILVQGKIPKNMESNIGRQSVNSLEEEEESNTSLIKDDGRGGDEEFRSETE